MTSTTENFTLRPTHPNRSANIQSVRNRSDIGQPRFRTTSGGVPYERVEARFARGHASLRVPILALLQLVVVYTIRERSVGRAIVLLASQL